MSITLETNFVVSYKITENKTHFKFNVDNPEQANFVQSLLEEYDEYILPKYRYNQAGDHVNPAPERLGQLAIWWNGFFGNEGFEFEVPNLHFAAIALDVLANYDEYVHKTFGQNDWCNAGGLNVVETNPDDETQLEFCTWYHPVTGDELTREYIYLQKGKNINPFCPKCGDILMEDEYTLVHPTDSRINIEATCNCGYKELTHLL